MSQSITADSKATSGSLRKLKSFGLTLSASLGTFGFFSVQGIILARMLGPDQRGVFAAAVMFPQALLYLGLLGAPELFAGYAAQGKPNYELRRAAARYGLLAGVISCVCCIFLDVLTIPSNMRSVLPLAILCALTMPLQQTRLAVQAVDHGQRKLARYNQVRLAAAAVFPMLLIIGFVLGFRDLTAACVLFFASQLLALGLAQLGMQESWLGPTAVPVKIALVEAKGLMGAWFSTELLERLDLVLMMVLIANEAELGFYAAAVPAAAIMIIVPNAAAIYAFNRGARQDERLSTRDAWGYLGIGLGVQFAIACVLAAILPILIRTFYGNDFGPAITFAWLLLPAGIFRGLLQTCDSYLRARKKPGLGAKARGVAVPILLGVSFFAEPWLGSKAIPVGLSIAQLVCFAIVAWGVVRDTHEPENAIAEAA